MIPNKTATAEHLFTLSEAEVELRVENEDKTGYGGIPTGTLQFLAHLAECVLACSIPSEQAAKELEKIRNELSPRLVANRNPLLPARHKKARE
jgi:hypothetical protein